MISETRPMQLPPLPAIGQPEAYYARAIRQADAAGDRHAYEASKVGQYVTLALDQHLTWEEKQKYFCHALKRHCNPPPMAEDEVEQFYKELAQLVRQYAGQEALRLASDQDDLYAARLAMGQTRNEIEDEAEHFFLTLVPAECPDWFNEEDFTQVRLIRDQWI